MCSMVYGEGFGQQADDGPASLDWDTSPKDFREAHKRTLEELKAKEARLAELEGKVTQVDRREAFEKAIKDAGVEGVTLEDVSDLPPDQITPTLLKVKAAEKEEQAKALLAKQAEAVGMTVEEFKATLDQVKAARAANDQGLTQQLGIATAPTAGEAPDKSAKEKAWDAYQEAIKNRVPGDQARAAYVRAMREATGATDKILQG